MRNVLALRGDPPATRRRVGAAPRGLRYASDLVSLIRSAGDFCVGVAAFPEGHPRSPDLGTDAAYFVRKCRAGADFAITQMFFFVDDYLRLRDRVAAGGGTVPIIAGIMPVTSMGTLEWVVLLSGARSPPGVADRLRAVAGTTRRCARSAAPRGWMCERPLAEGAPGLHLHTPNGSRATLDIYHRLGLAQRSAAGGPSRGGRTTPMIA